MTDKPREAALWKLLTEAREALWQPANPDLCGRIDEALAQQDAPSALCQRCVPVCRGGAGCFAGMPDTDPSKMTVVKVVSPAQQDAQAVPSDLVDKLRKFRGLPPHNNSSNVCQGDGYFYASIEAQYTPAQIAAANDMLNAAPTPPAQRVMLTDEEIIEMCDYQGVPDAQGECLARAVIEAYERKNGISQPGETE